MKFYERSELPALHAAAAFCRDCGSPTELRPTSNYFGKSGRDTKTGRPVQMFEAVCTKAGPQVKGVASRLLGQAHKPVLITEWVYCD